jgi:hypothetical protein
MPKKLSLGADRNPIIVQLTEYEGTRFVDIRRYYTDRKSNELLPTKKGISLSRQHFSCLRAFFNEAYNSIEEWLGGGSGQVAEEVGVVMAARQAAADEAAHEAKPFEVHTMRSNRGSFFSVTAEGNHYDLRLNESHPFVKDLIVASLAPNSSTHTKELDPATREFVATLLVSFRRATELFEGDDQTKADQLLRALEYEWSIILANYADAKERL